jgi:hypothetical protein
VTTMREKISLGSRAVRVKISLGKPGNVLRMHDKISLAIQTL